MILRKAQTWIVCTLKEKIPHQGQNIHQGPDNEETQDPGQGPIINKLTISQILIKSWKTKPVMSRDLMKDTTLSMSKIQDP